MMHCPSSSYTASTVKYVLHHCTGEDQCICPIQRSAAYSPLFYLTFVDINNFYRCKIRIMFPLIRENMEYSFHMCVQSLKMFIILLFPPSWVIHWPSKSNKGGRTYCSSHMRLMTSCQHTRLQLWNVEEIKPQTLWTRKIFAKRKKTDWLLKSQLASSTKWTRFHTRSQPKRWFGVAQLITSQVMNVSHFKNNNTGGNVLFLPASMRLLVSTVDRYCNYNVAVKENIYDLIFKDLCKQTNIKTNKQSSELQG